MGKIAKLFLFCTLLLVGVSFADLARPLYFSCGKRTDDGVYACNIRQLESTKSTLQPQYTKWGEFLQVFQNRIEMDLGDPSAKTEYNGFEIIFESDIDLGGYDKTNGTCRDATFAPMNFGPLAFQPTIDGNGKTIKNFCYIAEDENASFFSSLSNSTVKDITFLNAYVKAKTVSAGNRCGSLCDAAVVTNTAEQVAFENVAVKGASVYGWQTSTLAVTAKAVSTDLNTPAISLSHVTIQDVTLSMTRDVIAEYSDAEYRYDSQSASGGVVANLRGHFKMDDSLKVLNLSAPDSISKVFKDVTNKEYVGNRYVGGIAGYFSPSANDADFDLDSIEVSAALSGLWVGGLFGKIYINTAPKISSGENPQIEGSSSFKVKDSKVTLNSPVYLGGNIGTKNDMNRYFGGLVGELIWWKGPVLLLNNTVDVSADWHGDKEYTNAVYMGGLVGLVTGGKELSVVDVSAENDTVTAEMRTSSKSVYAGGILGRVGLETDDNGISGNVRISASRVKAKESNLITTTASEIITVNASYLVGNAVSREGIIDIQQNHAEGIINIENDALSGSGAVGAEVGLAWFYGAKIYNNTSVGDLLVKTVVSGAGLKISRGYVAGILRSPVSESKINVRNNFHYGSIDKGIYLAVGFLEVNSKEIPSTWRNTYSSDLDVRYNYRNALAGDTALAADGVLNINGTGEIIVNKNTGDSWYNGVIDADVMKSRLFTYVMNATQPSGSTVNWENEPSSLPVISEKRTAYRLAISLLDEDYIQLTPADTAALRDYLPVKQCEAKKCSLYVYTEDDLMLKSDLKSTFDELEAGFMLVDKLSTDVSGRFDYNQKFTKDKTVNGLTDREIEVEYIMKDLVGANNYVSVDKYADNMTFVMPKVDKIRLISGKGAVPVMMLNTDDANGNAPEYELDCNVAYNPCKAGVSLSECDENGGNFYVETTSKRMGTFEEVLKVVRKRYDDVHQNKIVLLYLPIDLSQGNGTLPRIDVGLFGTNTKINMTTYAYNGNGLLKESDSRELGDGIVTQSGVDMVSRYQFSLAERGFNVNAWKVDFWVDLEGKPIDAITQCYNEGSLTAKCAEANKYTNLSEKYFASENKIENVLNAALNGLIQNKPRLSMWSTVIDPNDSLSLDSMIYAMAVAIPTYAPKASVLIGVVPDLQVVSYTVNFDVNADGKNVFLTDKFMDELDNPKSYSRQNAETAKLPEGVLATNACFSGWDNGQIGVMGAKHYTSLDGDLLERANPNDDGSFNLYGNWVPEDIVNATCTPQNTEMALKVVDKTGAEGDFGTVTLNQSYKKLGKDTETFAHKFNAGKLEIPVSADAMTLHVASVQTNKEYDLAKLTLKKADGTELPIPLGPQDTSFRIAPASGVTDTLYAMFGGYIDVDVKVGRNDVFYGYDSYKKTLHLVEGGTTDLPMWVYTPTECVLGWSVTPDGADYDHGSVSSDVLSAKVTSEKTLYGVWGNADACVANADYRRLKLETEHGTVEIVEINTDDGSETKHAFADDFTMLLPQDYASSWVVRGAPEKGYKLDSVVIDGRIKLVEGDKLADSIQGYLPMKAYFSEDKAPVVSLGGEFEFVRHEPILSGNAMRLTLEWKVKPGKVAKLEATLFDDLGNQVEQYAESVADTSSYNWDVYPLLPGKYSARVTLKSDVDSMPPVVTAPFTVLPEIATAPDTWRMVSLSDVDQSAIVWDGDPEFYYWDESAKYGVVWKYQKYNGGMVNPQQGMWYNSLEGRPLVLRNDAATGSNVAQGTQEIVWELEKGWNMVANPYGWNISISQDNLEIYKWDASTGPVPASELGPYEAAWLHSNTDTTIHFAAKPSFVNAKGLQKAALAKATRESWTLQAVLEDAKGHSDSWNVLGVGEAKEWLEPPAGMGDYVNLSVVEGKKALLKSIKSADDGVYEWNLALSATTDRVGYLKFEGVKALNEMGLRVFVTIDGKTTEMGAGDSLKVLLKATGSTATVQVTSSEVRTVASKLENLRFARFPGALQVGFDVSSDLAGASYRVQLVGVNGKIAATSRGKSTAGHNTLALTAPKPGLYLLRVTLGGHSAVRKVAVH